MNENKKGNKTTDNMGDNNDEEWEAAPEQGMIVTAELWDQMTGAIEAMIENVKIYNNQDKKHDYESLKGHVLSDLDKMKQRFQDIQKENFQGRCKAAVIQCPANDSEARLKQEMLKWQLT